MKRFLAGLIALVMGHNLWAVGGGGFANQVVGTKAMGMGNAFSAVADDSSAVFFNPAGLTQIVRGEVTIGMAPHFPSSEYSVGGGTTKMDTFTPVVPNFYSAIPFASGKAALGFGIFTPYGLKALWPVDGPFRYVTTESDLSIPQFSPAIAYKVSENLSWGLGVIYAHGKATLKTALPVELININDFGGLPAGAPDGETVLEGDGQGWGANTGILYRPSENNSLALTWRSDIKIKLEGDAKLKGLSNEIAGFLGGSEYSDSVKTSITLPPSVMLGYAFKKERLTWAVDGEWIGFSSYRSTDLEFPSGSFFSNESTPHEFKDAWSIATGINYVLNDSWQTRAGYSFYPAVATEANWDPSVPDSDTHGVHLGGSWIGKSIGVDLSYSYLRYNNITINNTVGNDTGSTVNGDYKTAASIVSMNLTYKF